LTTDTPPSIRLATVSDRFFFPYSRLLFAMDPTVMFMSPCGLNSYCTFTVFYDGEESAFHYEVAPVTYNRQSSRYSTILVPQLWGALCAMKHLGRIKIIQNLFPAYKPDPVCIVYTLHEIEDESVCPMASEPFYKCPADSLEHTTPGPVYSPAGSFPGSGATQTNYSYQGPVLAFTGHSYVYSTSGDIIPFA